MAFLLLLDSTRRGTGCLGDSLAGSKRESRYDENQRSAPTAPISPRYTLRGRARLSYALRCLRLYRRRRLDGKPGPSSFPSVFPLPGQVMSNNEERGNRKVVEHKLPRRPRRLISRPASSTVTRKASQGCAPNAMRRTWRRRGRQGAVTLLTTFGIRWHACQVMAFGGR